MASSSVQVLFDQLLRRVAAGEAVVMCTVVATRGSCPQGPGARMLVAADGATSGTLGGGCVEAEVRKRAIELLSAGESMLLTFSLDHDYGWDDGLICGGAMDVHLDVVRDEAVSRKYRDANDALANNRSTTFGMSFLRELRPTEFRETLDPPARLVIAGAGHVGQALSKLGVDLGFDVTVIDDREDHLTAARFPSVHRRPVSDIASALSGMAIDEQTYVVIVTRGHHRDGQALAAVVRSNAKYVGLIGSKRKIKAIFDDLHAQGVSSEQLARVHAPIGLEIGAITVAEIAISIAAELVATRRGRAGQPAGAMKIDPVELDRWIRRNDAPV